MNSLSHDAEIDNDVNHYGITLLWGAVIIFLLPTCITNSITSTMGLTPLPVMIRKVRPFMLPTLVILLMGARLKHGMFSSGGEPSKGRILTYQYPKRGEPFVLPKFEESGILDVAVYCLRFLFSNLHRLLIFYFGESAIARSAMILLNDAFGVIFALSLIRCLQDLRKLSFVEVKDDMVAIIFEFAKENIPFIRNELAKEVTKLKEDVERKIKDPDRKITKVLPGKGRDHKSIIAELEQRSNKEDTNWKNGRVSGTVYSGEKSHGDLLNSVYSLYSLSNPLHADVWPSVNQFEAEVCSMTAALVNGGNDSVVGCMTSGGTESIILAVKAHRHYFGNRRGVNHPEIISCETAHAAIDKACEILSIKHIKIPCDPLSFQVRSKDVEAQITSNTIMIYSSAPNYPQGVIDPIEQLSELAVKYGTGLHVDSCLGGFVLPFAKQLGYDIPRFEFSLRGVSSMSCDTHKYGYASKGTSVVLYKNAELRRAQYFCYAKWTGGLYATPAFAGSRPGALIVSAWASLMALGEEGFRDRVRKIMEASTKIARAIADMDGMYILGGAPKAMIVCFGSKEFNIYRVGDAMAKRGWSLNSLQRPSCIHLCVTLKTAEHADCFVDELRAVVDMIRKEGNDVKESGNAAMYGMAGSLPAGPVNELLKCYTDVLLTA